MPIRHRLVSTSAITTYLKTNARFFLFTLKRISARISAHTVCFTDYKRTEAREAGTGENHGGKYKFVVQ